MTTKEKICRALFVAGNKRWFLFQHGTVLVAGHPAADPNSVVAAMSGLAKMLGPYGGEGSGLGDCRVLAKLKNFPGWLVDYNVDSLALVTIVLPEDLHAASASSPTEVMQWPEGTAMLSVRVALCGRALRNQDARDPQIVASGEVS